MSNRLLLTSPSQLQTFHKLCPRKWWFRYVHGLPEPEQSFQGFGKAVHKVVERYLKADATGRDPQTGKAVELYPEGWEQEFKLSPIEVDRIKRQVQAAIEKGVIYRPSGDYLVESGYEWDMPGVAAKERGYTDLLEEDAVVDHKTTSARKWALSVEKLKEDWQMRAYAMRLVRFYRSKGITPPEQIRLRHNVFVTKESEDVFSREATVSVAELDAHEQVVEQTVREMLTLVPIPATDWSKIENSPRPGSDGCNAYKGCPYRNICAGREQPAAYKLRMINASKSPAQLAEERTTSMPSIMSLLNKSTPTSPQPPAVQAVPETQAPAQLPAVQVVPQPAVPFAQPAPINPPAAATPAPVPNPAASAGLAAIQAPPAPWYNPAGCRACGTGPFPGFASNLKACRVCDSRAALEGRRTSMSYRTYVVDGVPKWEDPPPLPTQQMTDAEYVKSLEAPAAEEGPATRSEIKAQEEEGLERAWAKELSPGLEKAEEASQPIKRKGRPPGSKNKPKEGQMVVTKEVLGEPQVSNFLEDVKPPTLPPLGPTEVRNSPHINPHATHTVTEFQIDLEPLKGVFDELRGEFKTLYSKLDALLENRSTPATAPILSVPAEGFSLVIGGYPNSGHRISFFYWLEGLREAVAKHFEVDDYFQAETWPRRDALCTVARRAVKGLHPDTYILVPRELDPDSLAVVNALRGLAKQVIE